MSHGKDSRSGYKMVTGNMPDISEWLDFECYDLVWWIDWPNKLNMNDVKKRGKMAGCIASCWIRFVLLAHY